MPSNVDQIAKLMSEMDSPSMSGNVLAQDADTLMTINQTPTQGYEEGGHEEFTDDQLRLAKEFIELIGDAEQARDLLDKVVECEDCLGIVDDDEDSINVIASTMGSTPDMPMNNIAAQFDPGQI